MTNIASGGQASRARLLPGSWRCRTRKAGSAHGFANQFFYANPGKFTDITSVKTAVARRNFNNSVDDCLGTADRLRTFNDFSGSPTQFTGTGWDNVTGLGRAERHTLIGQLILEHIWQIALLFDAD
jgi:hypothetical protein